MQVVGLDLSTKAGVARLAYDKGLKAQLLNEITAIGKGVPRAIEIATKVDRKVESWKPQLVVLENYGFSNKHTLVTMVEIGTLVRYNLLVSGYFWIEVTPTTLKKFVCGTGGAKKDLVMKEAYKRWGVEGTDNEVDAFCLGMFGFAVAGKDVGLPKTNLESVTVWCENHPRQCNQLHDLI